MNKKLWCALVEHDVVPGTKMQFFAQDAAPTDEEVIARFSDMQDEQEQLSVVGMFDVSAELESYEASLQAFKAVAGNLLNAA